MVGFEQGVSRDWRRIDVGRRISIWQKHWEERGIAFAGRVFCVGFGGRGFGSREGSQKSVRANRGEVVGY